MSSTLSQTTSSQGRYPAYYDQRPHLGQQRQPLHAAQVFSQTTTTPATTSSSVPTTQSAPPEKPVEPAKSSNSKPPFPTPPPMLIDRRSGKQYTRGAVLGEGGFARCYEAFESVHGTKFAAKVIPKSSLKSQKQKSKLFGEINIHRMLAHENIVKWFEVFEDDEFVYMILEICECRTLVDMVKKRKRLTEPEVRYYMWQLLTAVRYMHHRRVIHRDLKLGNIFLSRDMTLKIGDFGLAAIIKKDGERKRTICGTPNYIAPEVLFDTNNGHSYEVDIWSLGVIMYTLLIGRPPFQTKDVKAIYKKIKENSYEFPPNLSISEEAKSLITSLLHTKPECRPMVEHIMQHEFFKAGPMPISIPVSALQSTPEFTSHDFIQLPQEPNVDALALRQLSLNPNPADVDNDLTKRSTLRKVPLNHNRAPIPEIWTNHSAPQQQKTFTPPVSPPLTASAPLSERPIHQENSQSPRSHEKSSSSYSSPVNTMREQPAEYRSSPVNTLRERPADYRSSPLNTMREQPENYRSSPLNTMREQPENYRSSPLNTMRSDRKLRLVSGSTSSPKLGSPAASLSKNQSTGITPSVQGEKSGTQALESMHLHLADAIQQYLANKESPAAVQEFDPSYYECPHFFITKWIDYCNKYGLGYQLRDGTVGVYFNDSTSIILAPDHHYFEYLYHDRSIMLKPGEKSPILRKSHTMDNYPTDLQKKVTLLKHFKNYMQDKLNKITPSTTESPQSYANLEFLTKYLRTKYGVIFRLSNHTVQMNLFDHTKIILSREGLRVTYINKHREVTTWPLFEALRLTGSTGKEVFERLKFARDMLHQMIVKKQKRQLETNKENQ